MCIDSDISTTGPVMFFFFSFKCFLVTMFFIFFTLSGTDGPYIRTVHCGGYFPDWIHIVNAIYFRDKDACYITLPKRR